MHLIFLKKIAFATLIARYLTGGVGVRAESGMGDGGRLESTYFTDWLFPNSNKSLLSRVLLTPVSFIVSLFL